MNRATRPSGVSLLRVTDLTQPSITHHLVWLLTFHRIPFPAAGFVLPGDLASPGSPTQRVRGAVLIDADTGKFLEAESY